MFHWRHELTSETWCPFSRYCDTAPPDELQSTMEYKYAKFAPVVPIMGRPTLPADPTIMLMMRHTQGS
jgi:hypothetical protein